MKKIIFIALLAFPSIGICQQNTAVSKVHSNAVKFLLKKLHNPDSYKSVSWGKLQKYYVDNFDESVTAKNFDARISYFKDLQKRLAEVVEQIESNTYRRDTIDRDTQYLKAIHLITQNNGYIDELNTKKEIARESFKPYFDHYFIEHTFRARNSYNALVLNTNVFYFDNKLNVISYDTSSLEDQESESAIKRQQLIDELNSLHN